MHKLFEMIIKSFKAAGSQGRSKLASLYRNHWNHQVTLISLTSIVVVVVAPLRKSVRKKSK